MTQNAHNDAGETLAEAGNGGLTLSSRSEHFGGTGPPPEKETAAPRPIGNGGSTSVVWGSDTKQVGSVAKYPGLVPASTNYVRGELIGSDIAIASGIAVNGNAPTLKLCRELVAAGFNPATRLEVYRGEVLCLTVRSIGEGAKLTVREDGMRFVAYRPGPNGRPRGCAGGSSPIALDDLPATPVAGRSECP
jgi:hypothetical protein